MTTPRFLLLILLLLATHALPQAALSAQPNIIFFITDDISPEDTGPYGSKVVKTPNLDRMAAEGMVFDNAYLTASSCSPSRCSIITGRYPHNTGAPELHLPLPKDQHTFVQDLRSAGYHTVISGKNHIGEPEDIGFEVAGKGGKPSGSEDWVTLLKERPKDKPFFAWFGSFDAHRDWQINDEAPKYDPADVEVPPYLFDGPQTRQDLADYYHEVSRTDYYLGQLFKELERQGIAEDTYVVYCADNGRPFPRCKTRLYDSGIKTPLLFWRPGTIQPARTASLVSSIDLSATFLDLAGLPAAPSIQGVSFAKILNDPKASVRDYVFAEHNWHVFNAHERMVRHGDWLYIRNSRPNQQNMCTESDDSFPAGAELWAAHAEGKTSHAQQDIFQNPRAAEELYHVGKDADQLYNLATDTTYQETLAELRQVLGQWTKETGDTNPEKHTPDRTVKRGPQPRGELPGQSANAAGINHPGPVRK